MKATVIQPVGPDDRVNDVLARDEHLVDVFVRHSAHFNKLRNRAMRRVMGRLVTVQDAARLADVSVGDLLCDLNAALGFTTPTVVPSMPPATMARANKPHPADAPVVTVDVRDDLRQGREPLARIMLGVNTLHDDEVLRVRAIFEPVPLLAVLAKRGFSGESVQHGPDDWSVWFWRDSSCELSETPRRDGATARAPAPPAEAEADDAVVLLDVRSLQPPEPLVRTLAALEALPVGKQLVQVNSRVPQLLLPMLAERGFACELDESHADRVLLRIWRPA